MLYLVYEIYTSIYIYEYRRRVGGKEATELALGLHSQGVRGAVNPVATGNPKGLALVSTW